MRSRILVIWTLLFAAWLPACALRRQILCRPQCPAEHIGIAPIGRLHPRRHVEYETAELVQPDSILEPAHTEIRQPATQTDAPPPSMDEWDPAGDLPEPPPGFSSSGAADAPQEDAGAPQPNDNPVKQGNPSPDSPAPGHRDGTSPGSEPDTDRDPEEDLREIFPFLKDEFSGKGPVPPIWCAAQFPLNAILWQVFEEERSESPGKVHAPAVSAAALMPQVPPNMKRIQARTACAPQSTTTSLETAKKQHERADLPQDDAGIHLTNPMEVREARREDIRIHLTNPMQVGESLPERPTVLRQPESVVPASWRR